MDLSPAADVPSDMPSLASPAVHIRIEGDELIALLGRYRAPPMRIPDVAPTHQRPNSALHGVSKKNPASDGLTGLFEAASGRSFRSTAVDRSWSRAHFSYLRTTSSALRTDTRNLSNSAISSTRTELISASLILWTAVSHVAPVAVLSSAISLTVYSVICGAYHCGTPSQIGIYA
jgi:hypothetical protein